MNKILKWNDWINEALKPSQYREYVLSFDREKYEKLFKSFEGEHDRNYYRIYLPIQKSKSETQIKIEELLDKYDYEIVNYIEGKAKFKSAKNITRIGQILQRIERNNPDETSLCKELSKKFVEDPDRKAGEDLMVCISRHPYDIAGSDTDRNWSNCLTMARTDTKRYLDHIDRIKKELSKLDLRKLGEQIDKILDEDQSGELYEIEKVDCLLMNEMDSDDAATIKEELKKHNIEVDDDLLVKYEDEDGFVETDNYEFNDIANKYNNVISLIEDMSKYVCSGTNVRYIINHVKSGVLMSYLIRKSDKNITNPIANLDIKPYFNIFDPSDIYLLSDTKMYGHGTLEYKKTVDNWVSEVNGDKCGIYRLTEGLYNDNLQNKTILVKEDGYVIRTNKDSQKNTYTLDKGSIGLYKKKLNSIKDEGEALSYILTTIKMIGDMSICGDIKSDILLSVPDKWRYLLNNKEIPKSWR